MADNKKMNPEQAKKLLGVYDNLRENEIFIQLMDFIDNTIREEGKAHFVDEHLMINETERNTHYLKVAALEMVKADLLTFLENKAKNLRSIADANKA